MAPILNHRFGHFPNENIVFDNQDHCHFEKPSAAVTVAGWGVERRSVALPLCGARLQRFGGTSVPRKDGVFDLRD
jgi:hypothetical protein